jgi:CDP-glucose 4,6-dehydratase
MAALWGEGAGWRADGGEHPHEAAYLSLDASKAQSRLAWRPALDVQQALELTVDWARARRQGADMRRHTLAQIESYQAATAG